MAQRRMIARKITQNKKLAQLKSPWAKLMYTWMIPHTDDYGRLPGDAELLKALIFPREHKTLRKIEELRNDLEGAGLIKVYEVDGSKYIQLLGFDNYQTFKSDRPKQKECPDIPDGNQMETDVFPKLSKDKLSKEREGKAKKKHPLSPKDRDLILKNKDHYLKTYGITNEYIINFFDQCEAKGYKYANFAKALLVWWRKDRYKKKEVEHKPRIVRPSSEPISTKEALKKMGYKVGEEGK